MKEENLIHTTYSACFNDENNNNHSHALFHNCFHSYQILDWLVAKQLCKTIDDGKEIFQVLAKLKIIHHGESNVQIQFVFDSIFDDEKVDLILRNLC